MNVVDAFVCVLLSFYDFRKAFVDIMKIFVKHILNVTINIQITLSLMYVLLCFIHVFAIKLCF